MLKIEQASAKDIPLIHELAKQVWEPTYGALLEKAQLDYMFEMMYSQEALVEQLLQKNHVFFIASVEDSPVGYMSIEQQGESIFHLHKIYVVPAMQGHGIGNFMLQKAVVYSRSCCGGKEFVLKLHVNRYNKGALDFYERMGFERIAEQDFAIGNNYYMNDYVLQLSCS